jgi:hypothetical protein
VAGGRIARGLALGAPVFGASSAALASWVTARRITAPGPREQRFLTPWDEPDGKGWRRYRKSRTFK